MSNSREYNQKYYRENREYFKEYRKKYWQKNKEKIKEQRKAYSVAYYAENKQKTLARNKKLRERYIEQWKKLLGEVFGLRCSICGYDKCFAALEFHHTTPKESNEQALFRMIGRKKPSKANLDKLGNGVFVCANCHREIHHANLRI